MMSSPRSGHVHRHPSSDWQLVMISKSFAHSSFNLFSFCPLRSRSSSLESNHEKFKWLAWDSQHTRPTHNDAGLYGGAVKKKENKGYQRRVLEEIENARMLFSFYFKLFFFHFSLRPPTIIHRAEVSRRVSQLRISNGMKQSLSLAHSTILLTDKEEK